MALGLSKNAVTQQITEAHIQRTVKELLEWDGWRALRTDPVSDRATVNAIRRALLAASEKVPALRAVISLVLSIVNKCVRGKGFGEVGMADYLFIRYDTTVPFPLESCGEQFRTPWAAIASVLWVEFKRPGANPTKEQFAWGEAERDRGALVLVVDDIDEFIEWYKQSGLQRKSR